MPRLPPGAALFKMALDPTTLDYKGAMKFLPHPTTLNYKGAMKFLPRTTGQRTIEQDVLDLIETAKMDVLARYVGPLPATGDLAGWAMLEKSFAPIFKLRECAGRHVRGVIGREPQFESVLDGIEEPKKKRLKRDGYREARTDAEALADEADDVQGDVWDERGEHKIAKAACKRLISTGKVFLRYDIPPGLVEEFVDFESNETFSGIAAESWQDAYRLTHMELCPRGSAAVYTDPSTLRKTAFYSYAEEDDSGKKTRCVQVSFLNDEGLTQVRVFKDSSAEPQEWEVDCGGTLLVVEAELEPLITPDLLQLQDIACSIATMVKVNADVAGFPSVDAIDIAPPTVQVAAPTEADPTATKRVPVTLPNGPRTIRATYSEIARDNEGNPLTGEDNKPILRQGRLQYRDPVSSQPLRDDIEFFNTEIYSGFNQRHIQARTSANASAQMLVEMRSDYADSLLETKPDLEKLLRAVFKGRLCMAASLASGAEAEAALKQFKAGRVRVDLMLNAGPLSVEEKNEILARREAGLLSDETSMVLLGTEDFASEILKLNAQKATAEGLNATPIPKAKPKTEVPLAT